MVQVFDVVNLHNLLNTCMLEDGSIQMDPYVDAYDELCRLFGLLGKVFSFVVSDVVEKVGILREHRNSEVAENYKTIASMLDYEVANKIMDKKSKLANGSRTLLRLHRALEFTIEFIKCTTAAEHSKNLHPLASDAYERSLAKHHPWIVRKGVHLALYILPTVQGMYDKMNKYDMETTIKTLNLVVDVGQPLFEAVEKMYTDRDLHGLP